jgi:1-acyl-sn-glycerol-3-phosphate acyltransferase
MKTRDATARYRPRWAAAFERYLAMYLAAHFDALRLSPLAGPARLRPRTVFYCNHASWWDPLVLFFVLRRSFPGTRVYGPIEAAALDRYRFLAHLGLFPIESGTRRGAAAFLRESTRVLAASRSVLCVTAEGRFADPRGRPIRLERGVAHLLEGGHAEQAVPIALEYPFWTESKPQALVRFGSPVAYGESNRRRSGAVDEVLARLEGALEGALDRLARDSIERRAASFVTLLEDRRRGVGGPYDWYRRLRFGRFDASHGSALR